MSSHEKNNTAQAISDALRAKRENRNSTAHEIAALEEALIADIENFDLDAMERQARQQPAPYGGNSRLNANLAFPEIAPNAQDFHPLRKTPVAVPAAMPPVATPTPTTGFLDGLRQQAAERQLEMHSAMAERSNINETIDSALKKIFFFLHDVVQQLNILKPAISRSYPLIEQHELRNLVWQEGFTDYRSQSQSTGALLEMVTFSYQIGAPANIVIERDGPAVDRFRALLFDYGLQFSCQESRNERRYVEKAEFDIQSQLSISARWRADYAQGNIVLETRNLERLGSVPYTIRPEVVDQALLDAFGALILNRPNPFRELLRRPR